MDKETLYRCLAIIHREAGIYRKEAHEELSEAKDIESNINLARTLEYTADLIEREIKEKTIKIE